MDENRTIRTIIVYKNYFREFFEKQRNKVKDKIIWTFDLIEAIPKVPETYLKHIEGTDGLYETGLSYKKNSIPKKRIFEFGKTEKTFMKTLFEAKDTTFFELLKNKKGLDLRDNRGKIHCFSTVILGVIIALYRCRDGNLSSIHRALTNTQADLCKALGIAYTPAVSRAQLPIILKKRISQSSQKYIFHFLELS